VCPDTVKTLLTVSGVHVCAVKGAGFERTLITNSGTKGRREAGCVEAIIDPIITAGSLAIVDHTVGIHAAAIELRTPGSPTEPIETPYSGRCGAVGVRQAGGGSILTANADQSCLTITRFGEHLGTPGTGVARALITNNRTDRLGHACILTGAQRLTTSAVAIILTIRCI